MNESIAKVAEVTKKHGVKAVGGLSIASVVAIVQMQLSPLTTDYRETRKDVQDLRERIGQMEWRHEHEDKMASRRVDVPLIEHVTDTAITSFITNTPALP